MNQTGLLRRERDDTSIASRGLWGPTERSPPDMRAQRSQADFANQTESNETSVTKMSSFRSNLIGALALSVAAVAVSPSVGESAGSCEYPFENYKVDESGWPDRMGHSNFQAPPSGEGWEHDHTDLHTYVPHNNFVEDDYSHAHDSASLCEENASGGGYS